MKKHCYLLILFALSAALLHAEFSIGCYSYLRGTDGSYEYAQCDTISGYMQAMGYNLTLMTTYNTPSLANTGKVIAALDRHGIDAIFNDQIWSTDTNSLQYYTAAAITKSNWMVFEAEYKDSSDVNPSRHDSMDDRFWYCAGDEFNGNMPRIGMAEEDKSIAASNGYVWKCNRKTMHPGYAYTDLRYRWQNTPDDHTESSYRHLRIGPEFIFPSYEGCNIITPTNFLYLTYRLKINNLDSGTQPNTPLLRFETMGYRNPIENQDSTTVVHFNTAHEGMVSNWQSILTYGDLIRLADTKDYLDIELKIAYTDLTQSQLMVSEGGGIARYVLRNLNPRLYWYGNCDLYLDKITVEDQIHRHWRQNMDLYTTRINERINQMPDPHHRIKYVYGHEEIFQPQFDSYALMQNALQKDYFVAHFNVNFKDRMLKNTKDWDSRYDHLQNLRQTAHPRIMEPDDYVFTPWVSASAFNNQAPNRAALQFRMEDRLLRQYRDCKLYAMQERGRQFIPCLQAFGATGKIKGNYGIEWQGWVLPPSNMIKMLKLLPLCYGPDATIDFLLLGHKGSSTFYGALDPMPNRPPVPNPMIYNPVVEANRKVAVYGPIVSSSTWLESDSLRVKSNTPYSKQYLTALSGSFVNEMKVLPADHQPYYQGFVQNGIFRTASGPAFMLVNRRTNFFIPDAKVKQPKHFPVVAYAAAYPIADAQKVRAVLSKNAFSEYGPMPCFFDPYDSTLYKPDTQNGAVQVTLEAGDGKLLRLVSSLPAMVKKSATLHHDTHLSGKITINKKANITIDPNSHTTLYPGTVITVAKGANLTINGDLLMQQNARIIVKKGGNLNIRSHSVQLDPNSTISINGKPWMTQVR